MRGSSAPALLFSVVAVIALTGCLASPVHLNPGSVDGRDGGGPTPTYPMLMRVAAAAQSGGDFANAVGVYRRAAEMAPQDPAPLIAAGDALLQMGAVNEAIVSYNQALVRPGDTQGAQIGLAKAFLKTGKPELALAPLRPSPGSEPRRPQAASSCGGHKRSRGTALRGPVLLSQRPRPCARRPGSDSQIWPCRSP